MFASGAIESEFRGAVELQHLSRRTSEGHKIYLIVMLGIEVCMFYFQVTYKISPYFPPNFDQTTYFLQTLELVQRFHTTGWSALAANILHPVTATGATFTLQGALLALMAGPTRTAMLSINLLYFIALQLVLFDTIRHRTRNVDLAWVALALLLSLTTIFNVAGGIYDYRIDFSALCLYGIWTCLIIRSHGLMRPRSGLAIAVIGILLVCERFFTILYVGIVLVVLFALTVLYARLRASAWSPFSKQRCKNVFIAGALTALVTFPLLFMARTAIYNYYVANHVLGEERYIRVAEVGISSTIDYILYYPRSILGGHLGRLTLWLIGALAVVSVARGVSTIRSARLAILVRLMACRVEFLALLLATLVPLILLTLDVSKSPVVGGIVVTPIVLMMVLLCSVFWEGDRLAPSGVLSTHSQMHPGAKAEFATWRRVVRASRPSAIVAASFLVVALASFFVRGTANLHHLSRMDLGRITWLNESIARYALAGGNPSPSISFDRVVDYLNLGTVRLVGYERFGRLLDLQPRFGHGQYGIFATPRDEALKLIADSDIVVLTDPLRERTQPYPMNARIREYWEELRKSVDSSHILLLSTDISNVPHKVFVRTVIPEKVLGGH